MEDYLNQRIDEIKSRIGDADEADPDTLDECVNDALAGVEHVFEHDSMIEQTIGVAEMKGEWTMRDIRSENATEAAFAGDFAVALAEALRGDMGDYPAE